MAEIAQSQRAGKQRWAEPGSAHDRLVKWTKVILPARALLDLAGWAEDDIFAHG
jgi:hypothetical protein